jgi:hypothetical protein
MAIFRWESGGAIVIPVTPAAEPATFDAKVRQPGLRFLARGLPPGTWTSATYWRKALPDLRIAYSAICCYSAEWVPSVTGTSSVDHFVPRSSRPDLAYEWSNFRHAAARLNARKGDAEGILDPFGIGVDWFSLDFPSLQVKPGLDLPSERRDDFYRTVAILHLNDETSIASRMRWVKGFCEALFVFAYLKESAPFIAREIERQELMTTLQDVMRF